MDIQHKRQRLLNEERDLRLQIERLGGESPDGHDTEVQDSSDLAVSDLAKSEAFDERTVASQRLTDVRDALRRIDDGTYAKCVVCGRPIEEARLDAVPWARYCLEDQRKLEKPQTARPTL